ncbi:TolC family protein [Halocola ammonii]
MKNKIKITIMMSSLKFLLLVSLIIPASVGVAQDLTEYQKLAAENNPGLKAEYKEFEATLERAATVGSLPNPTLSFGYFLSPVETRVGPQQAKVSLSQMFPWFGSLSAKENRLKQQAEARFFVFEDSKNRLFLDVAKAYYPLVEVEEEMRLERENLDLWKNLKSFVTQQFESGKSPMSDVLIVEMSIRESKTKIEVLESRKEELKAEFNALLNREETEDVVIQTDLKIDGLEEMQTADSLIQNNPKLSVYDRQIESTRFAEEAAEKSGLPGVGLGIDYVVVGERSDVDLPDNGKDVVMPMVSVSLPIFRRQYKAAKREAQLMREGYELKKENVENELQAELSTAKARLFQKAEWVNLYERQIEEAQRILELLRSEYANSGTRFDEILRIRQKINEYEKLKVEALVGYHVELARIRYVTSNVN